MIVNKVFIINKDLKKLLTQNINIAINYNNNNKEIVKSIEKLSNKFPGNYNLVLHLKSLKGINQKVLIKKIKFSISTESLIELKSNFGSFNVWLSN